MEMASDFADIVEVGQLTSATISLGRRASARAMPMR
ncbi:hypothetical protein [Micromonospora luteifusca]